MSIDSKHPLYTKFLPDWEQMRDSLAGERAVKEKGSTYLPPTSGMVADGMGATDPGYLAYLAYKTRARYPDLVKTAVKALLGVMHREKPEVKLPAALEYLREDATLNGDSIQMLLRKINEEQLSTGRLGLLGDVIDQGEREGELYIAVYDAEDIINWDDTSLTKPGAQGLNLVVLNETAQERTADGFEWHEIERYRVLMLGDVMENEGEGVSEYRVGTFREKTSFSEDDMVTPSVKGRTMKRIPFVFVNAVDLDSTPDEPPLLGLSNLSMAIYRGEADYRQSLFMQGQDTLVIVGTTTDSSEDGNGRRVGAGAVIEIPTVGGDAKFIGVDSSGLEEQRMSLENDYTRGEAMTGQLLDTTSREKESAQALRTRVSVRTATLNEIAMNGAMALQTILRKMAEWVGADPEEVVVIPNLAFVDDMMTGDELVRLMGAKNLGAPLSLESIHKQMSDRGLTDKAFEDEIETIQKEREAGIMEDLVGASSNPDGPQPGGGDGRIRARDQGGAGEKGGKAKDPDAPPSKQGDGESGTKGAQKKP